MDFSQQHSQSVREFQKYRKIAELELGIKFVQRFAGLFNSAALL